MTEPAVSPTAGRVHVRTDEYAIPIYAVQEIIHYSKRSVTSRTSWMLGMIRLCGRITPVCDIASRLGTAYGISGQGKIVIIEADAARTLIVETVEEVLTRRRRSNRAHPR
jgi:purine-binding chemotaxis protein CheW